MEELLVVALAGFLASMVDGALGMGFGPTSSSILLSAGVPPAAASATVNLAKVATGLAAAVSHWKFDNIDRRLVLWLAIPGAAGAIIGTTVLANVDGDTIRPVLAVLLLLVGLRILVRFSSPLPRQGGSGSGTQSEGGERPGQQFDQRGTGVAATVGGVTNGLIGAWGPVVTPYLLHRGTKPRYAVGSVNTAEVAVAAVASGSLLGSLGAGGLQGGIILAMLAGGVVAAPVAAWLVRFVPTRGLGLAVAGLLLLTQSRELSGWAGIGLSRWLIYGAVPVLVVAAAWRPRLAARRRLALT
jgi:uncharacterized protein